MELIDTCRFIFEMAMCFYLLCMVIRMSLGINKSVSCLVGKTVLVTGGSTGIGYQICLNLASRGCRLIMADKIDDLERIRLDLIRKTDNPNIECMKLDLASFKSIREFVEGVKRTCDRLDVLINNAGILVSKCQLTEDGFNDIWQVNHLGPFLLTHLLLDLLKKSAPSRIIFTSSAIAYFMWNFEIEENELRTPSNREKSFKIYGDTKLATAITSHRLAEKIKAYDVTCNCLHPGCVRHTNIIQDRQSQTRWTRFLNFCYGCLLMMKDPWEGSQTTLHLATSRDVTNVTGKFFIDCKAFLQPRFVCNTKISQKIWETTTKFCGLDKLDTCFDS